MYPFLSLFPSRQVLIPAHASRSTYCRNVNVAVSFYLSHQLARSHPVRVVLRAVESGFKNISSSEVCAKFTTDGAKMCNVSPPCIVETLPVRYMHASNVPAARRRHKSVLYLLGRLVRLLVRAKKERREWPFAYPPPPPVLRISTR